jgi:hypothetical protein
VRVPLWCAPPQAGGVQRNRDLAESAALAGGVVGSEREVAGGGGSF